MSKVTVIVPTFNSKVDLEFKSIPSVLSQTFKDLELIIIDDGSTDGTANYVNNFLSIDSRIRYYYQNNKGQASARNFGIKKSSGDYIAFLDADDVWLPDKIEKQVNKLKNAEATFCFCDYIKKYSNQKEEYTSQNPGDNFFKEILMAKKSALPSTLMVKREVFSRVLFNESPELRYIEDIDFILQLAAREGFEYIPEALTIYFFNESKKDDDRMLRFIKIIEKETEKFRLLFSKKELSCQFRFLGSALIKIGEIKKGRKYFLNSLKYDASNYLTLAYYLISFLGVKAYNYIQGLRQKSVGKFVNNYSYKNLIHRSLAYIIDFIGKLLNNFRDEFVSIDLVKKMLIVKLDNIGDCFLMAPIFKKLKSKNNNLKIDVVCLEASKDIFVNVEGVDNVIAIKNRSLKELLSILLAIKKEEYDLFIDARGYAKVALFGFLSGIKRRVGFLEEVFSFLYTKKIKPPMGYHESVRYYFLLRELGIAVEDWKPALLPNISMNFLNLGEKVCAIHPGASLPYKRWPLENWIDLIEKILLQNEEIKIAILGSKDEAGLADEIIKKVGGDRVYSLVGKMSLLENYHFLSKCKMFIGSDSALGHLAGPQEIATIILMNRALDKGRWKPLGSKVKVITANNNNHICKFDKCEYPCLNMKAIEVSGVINEFNRIKEWKRD